MAKKTKKEDATSEYLMPGIDPSVEARVDKLMNEDDTKSSEASSGPLKIPVTTSSGSAPLLPGEKLPKFDDTPISGKENSEQTKDARSLTAKDNQEEPRSEAAWPQAETGKDEIGIENPATEQAVDDIVSTESDRLLADEDAKAGLLADNSPRTFKKNDSGKKSWFRNWRVRAAFLFFILIISAVGAAPSSRYTVLNLAGVRVETSMRIVDDKTGQPLKNVEVSVSGKNAKTDKEGKVRLEEIKLGSQQLLIKKPAFAETDQKITLGWGSNPLGDIRLVPVGSRYTFEVKGFVSGKPITSAEAVSGEASARANDKGEIVLVVGEKNTESEVAVEVSAPGYRQEKITIPLEAKDTQRITLVPDRKQAFVSKRSGKYDLFKIDIDGKNEEKILAGTGREKEDGMVILPHDSKDIVAFASSRSDKYSSNGTALSSLNIIDLRSNEVTEIAQSERIQLIDFIDNRLIFIKVSEGSSMDDVNRHRLVSYDIDSAEEKELASTNYFNDVLSAKGIVYYTPAAYQVKGTVGLYSIKADGTGKNTIFGEEVWNLFRTSYNKIAASAGQTWHEYDTGNAQFSKLEGPPPVLKSRNYTDSPNSKKSAWVDDRDGKGVLLVHDIESNREDNALITQSGLQNPVRWLDEEHLVYRVSNTSETADYVISLSGGEPKKIVNVTNTAGLDREYYY